MGLWGMGIFLGMSHRLLIARTLIIAPVPMLSVGLRDPCEGDLGGTENLVKPSESLWKEA